MTAKIPHPLNETDCRQERGHLRYTEVIVGKPPEPEGGLAAYTHGEVDEIDYPEEF